MQKVGFEPGTFRAADPRRCPLGHSGSRQKWFSCAIYAFAVYTCYSIITGYQVTASLLVGTDRTWCWREAIVDVTELCQSISCILCRYYCHKRGTAWWLTRQLTESLLSMLTSQHPTSPSLLRWKIWGTLVLRHWSS